MPHGQKGKGLREKEGGLGVPRVKPLLSPGVHQGWRLVVGCPENDSIMAVIRNNQKQIYLPMLKEEEVYAISNFKAVSGPKKYKTVDTGYSINFFYKTKIEKLRQNGKKKQWSLKMDVVRTDQRNEAMLVTLLEDRAMKFLDILSTLKDVPILMVITVLGKKFSGKQEELPALRVEQFVTSTGDSVYELPITSILEMVLPMGTQVIRCICRAKIVAILDGTGWYYNYCPTCALALRDLDGKFYCLACNEGTQSLTQRFRIVVRVEDQSGSTTITLFNKEADRGGHPGVPAVPGRI